MPQINEIEVKLFATLRTVLGVASVSLKPTEPITVRRMIDMLDEKIGSDITDYLLEKDRSTMKVGTIILLDGKNIHHLNGLETEVNTTAVAIFPPAGGG